MKIFYILIIGGLFTIGSISANAASTPSVNSTPSPKFASFTGSINNNKVVLEWKIEDNQSADQFVVEKSEDGKNFVTAALVFGTDKAESDQYMFYEKAGIEKLVYRIKLINKDQQISYSALIEINPVKSQH